MAGFLESVGRKSLTRDFTDSTDGENAAISFPIRVIREIRGCIRHSANRVVATLQTSQLNAIIHSEKAKTFREFGVYLPRLG